MDATPGAAPWGTVTVPAQVLALNVDACPLASVWPCASRREITTPVDPGAHGLTLDTWTLVPAGAPPCCAESGRAPVGGVPVPPPPPPPPPPGRPNPTVTVKVAVTVLGKSSASVTVQVTVVVPTGKTEPDAGEQPTVGLGMSSSTTVGGVYVTTTGVRLNTVMLAGTPVRARSVSVAAATLTFAVPLAPAVPGASSRIVTVIVLVPLVT